MKQHQQVQEELREMNEVYQKSKVWLAVQTRACSFVLVTCQVCVYAMYNLFLTFAVAVWDEGR